MLIKAHKFHELEKSNSIRRSNLKFQMMIRGDLAFSGAEGPALARNAE
jgi:hypothetical protein